MVDAGYHHLLGVRNQRLEVLLEYLDKGKGLAPNSVQDRLRDAARPGVIEGPLLEGGRLYLEVGRGEIARRPPIIDASS